MSTNSYWILELTTAVFHNLLWMGLCAAGIVVGWRFRYRRGARWCWIGCGMLLAAYLLNTYGTIVAFLVGHGVIRGMREFDSVSRAAMIFQGVVIMAWRLFAIACVVIGFARSIDRAPLRSRGKDDQADGPIDS